MLFSRYAFGGYNGTDRLNDLYEYRFDAGAWTRLHGDQAQASHQPPIAIQRAQHPHTATTPLAQTAAAHQDALQALAHPMTPDRRSGAGAAAGPSPSPAHHHDQPPPPPGAPASSAQELLLQGVAAEGDASGLHSMSSLSLGEWGSAGLGASFEAGPSRRVEVPSGRSSLVSVVYKNSLFVFGGYNGQVLFVSWLRALLPLQNFLFLCVSHCPRFTRGLFPPRLVIYAILFYTRWCSTTFSSFGFSRSRFRRPRSRVTSRPSSTTPTSRT